MRGMKKTTKHSIASWLPQPTSPRDPHTEVPIPFIENGMSGVLRSRRRHRLHLRPRPWCCISSRPLVRDRWRPGRPGRGEHPPFQVRVPAVGSHAARRTHMARPKKPAKLARPARKTGALTPAPAPLVDELRALIRQTRANLAQAVNSTLVLT